MQSSDLTIIGTCPTFRSGMSVIQYRNTLFSSLVRAESHGWASMLIYSDNSQIDPWLVAKLLLDKTSNLSPLVALQPLSMHPATVAKMLSSLSIWYERPVHLNFISGGFPRDLESFCDHITHNERYDRLVEYAEIIRLLLTNKTPVDYAGKYYNISSLLSPRWSILPTNFQPLFTVSGSSEAGLAAARKLGARAIQYLRPYSHYGDVVLPPTLQYGARIGIIARESREEAWRIARRRYPHNAHGEKYRQYYTSISDSVWVKELSTVDDTPDEHPYWLGPYKNFQASCPFLVGKMDDVTAELSGYIRMGLRTFLLENPIDDEDASYITRSFEAATQIANHLG